jgi:hypothetical protein
MMLNDLLLQNKHTILERWFSLILGTYPTDLSKLLKKEKDRFVNPAGFTFYSGIEALFEELLRDSDTERLIPPLESIVRIRAVQDFSPSQAVGFVYQLKKAVQDALGTTIDEKSILQEWLKFQSKIDQLALQAFDLYMDCREKIFEIEVDELRTQKEMALKMLRRMSHPSLREKEGKDGG